MSIAGILLDGPSMVIGVWLAMRSARELSRHQIEVERQELTEILEEEEQEEIAILDKHMAQQYCAFVDSQPPIPKLQEASPEDVCFFLWNLTSISGQTELQIFHNPGMIHLLREGWANEIGWSMVLLGIATLANVFDHESIQTRFIHEEA